MSSIILKTTERSAVVGRATTTHDDKVRDNNLSKKLLSRYMTGNVVMLWPPSLVRTFLRTEPAELLPEFLASNIFASHVPDMSRDN